VTFANSLSPGRRFSTHGVCQGIYITRGAEKAILSMGDDLTAPGHIGSNDGFAHRGRFEQTA
jgi:hypothetical protein